MTPRMEAVMRQVARLPEYEQDELAARIEVELPDAELPDHEATFGPFAELVKATDWP